MTSRRFFCLLVVLSFFSKSIAAEKIHIHFISGAREYKSEECLKAFIPWLENHYSVKSTVSWGHDGIKSLDNLYQINDADVLFVFTRRMDLPEAQMKLIRAHWESGKAIVGGAHCESCISGGR